MTVARISGTIAVFIISFTLSKIFVPVTPATRLALEETGEHLSPKYMPDIITPAVITGSTPPLLAKVIKITPTVPAVPNEVPRA